MAEQSWKMVKAGKLCFLIYNHKNGAEYVIGTINSDHISIESCHTIGKYLAKILNENCFEFGEITNV